MKKVTLYLSVLIVTLFSFGFFAGTVFAQGGFVDWLNQQSANAINIGQVAPDPQVSFGGQGFDFKPISGCDTPGGTCSVGWIGTYVGAVYEFGVGAAAVLAVVMMMVGGFLWLISAGSPDKIGRAKEFITSALTGLLIALFSYIMLFAINPDLVSLDDIVIGVPDKFERVASQTYAPGVGSNGFGTNNSAYYTTDGQEYTMRNEGYREDPYADGNGYSAGFGHYFGDGQPGRSLTRAEAEALFEQDYDQAFNDAVSFVGGEQAFRSLTPARQTVLIDMAYNLGGPNLNEFTNLRSSVLSGNWNSAASSITNSTYATQVGDRAQRNALIMLSGTMDALRGN